MDWFNPFGLVFIILIMVPNIVFAIKNRDGFENSWKNRGAETLEQIGRYTCFATMIFNVPFTCFGFLSHEAFVTYLTANGVLVLAYCLIWIVCFRKNSLFRALSLSVIPSVIFLFSGIISRSVLLAAGALIFAPCHIIISCKNASAKK